MKNSKIKKFLAIFCALAVVGSLFAFAFAGPTETVKVIGDLLGYVVDIFVTVGIILLIYGICQMVLAFKDDNPDSKQRATVMLVIGAVLCGLRALVGTVLKTAGVNGITIGSGLYGSGSGTGT